MVVFIIESHFTFVFKVECYLFIYSSQKHAQKHNNICSIETKEEEKAGKSKSLSDQKLLTL